MHRSASASSPPTPWSAKPASSSAYDRLHTQNPDLTAALLTYTVRIQAERLAFTSRQVAALQR
jgi:hypothetical protein